MELAVVNRERIFGKKRNSESAAADGNSKGIEMLLLLSYTANVFTLYRVMQTVLLLTLVIP